MHDLKAILNRGSSTGDVDADLVSPFIVGVVVSCRREILIEDVEHVLFCSFLFSFF